MRSQHAIHLFGKRLAQVAGSQARPRRAPPECANKTPPARRTKWWWYRPARSPCRAARFAQNRFQSRQNSRGGLEQCLAGQHQVQIVIRVDLESLQNLVEHLAMLRGDADLHVESGLGCSRRLRITGQSLIASGRVPKISRILCMRKALPRSAGAAKGNGYLCR